MIPVALNAAVPPAHELKSSSQDAAGTPFAEVMSEFGDERTHSSDSRTTEQSGSAEKPADKPQLVSHRKQLPVWASMVEPMEDIAPHGSVVIEEDKPRAVWIGLTLDLNAVELPEDEVPVEDQTQNAESVPVALQVAAKQPAPMWISLATEMKPESRGDAQVALPAMVDVSAMPSSTVAEPPPVEEIALPEAPPPALENVEVVEHAAPRAPIAFEAQLRQSAKFEEPVAAPKAPPSKNQPVVAKTPESVETVNAAHSLVTATNKTESIAKEMPESHSSILYEMAAAKESPKTPTSQPVAEPQSVTKYQEIEETLRSGPTAPRDVSVRLSTSDDKHIDIRVMERGGELRVAVHTADPQLTRSMRNNLDQLGTQLERNGFESPVFRSAESGGSNNQNRDSQNGPDDGKRQSGGQGDRQQQQNRKQQPAWLDEWETSWKSRQPA